MPRETQHAWLFAFVVILILSVLKTVGAVTTYPYGGAVYLVNYQEGFIKRGFFGSVVFPRGGTVTIVHVTLVASAILLTLLLAFGVFARRMLSRHGEIAPFLVLFASSMGVVYLVSTIGYLDHVLLLLAILTLLPSGVLPRMVLTLVLGCVAILVHEAAALMVIPLMYFAVILSVPRAWNAPIILIIFCIGSIHAMLTYYVSFFGTLDNASIDRLRAYLEARANFPLSDLAFDILARTPEVEMSRTLRVVNIVAHVDSLTIVAPALFPLLWVSGLAFKQLGRSALLWVFWLAASLSPAALRFVGTDIHRWDAITVCTTFMALYLVLTELPSGKHFVPQGRWVGPAVAVALVISASGTTFLLREGGVRQFPFFELRSLLFEQS